MMTYNKFTRSPKEEVIFAEESAMAQTALAIADLLAKTGITERELATRLGWEGIRISKILSADSNLYVRTLARIGQACGYRMVVEFRPLAISEESSVEKSHNCKGKSR